MCSDVLPVPTRTDTCLLWEEGLFYLLIFPYFLFNSFDQVFQDLVVLLFLCS